MAGFKASRDDTVIRKLRTRNIPVQDMNEAADQRVVTTTLLVLVKSAGIFVPPPAGLRQKNPYNNNNPRMYKKYVWWKFMGNLTLYQTRLKVGKIVDLIAAKVHHGEPIAALRFILMDWATGEPMPGDQTQDYWYFTKGFGSAEIDDMTLRGWGLPINSLRNSWDGVVEPIGVVLDSEKLHKETLFRNMLPEAANASIVKVISELPKRLTSKGVQQVDPTLLITPVDIRRVIVSLQAADTSKRLCTHLLHKYKNDDKWAASIGRSFSRRKIEHEGWEWATKEVERLLANKINKIE
jgi:hypothetical protein